MAADQSSAALDPAAARVLVTGFGPFGSFDVNPSWEVMKSFDGKMLAGHLPIVAHQLPVVYDTVGKAVPALYERYPNLRLCVHCGVGLPGGLRLEQRARNGPYCRLDNNGVAPETQCCTNGVEPEQSYNCVIDLQQVVKRVLKADPSAKVSLSDNAGLYLCEFSYFTSLHLNRTPSLFLHVPPLGQPYSLEELRQVCGLVLEAVAAELPRPRVGLAVLLRNRTLHPGCIVVGRRLAKHSDGNTHGLDAYAAPGGHLEFGESFEECARREALEECGVQLKQVAYGTTLNVRYANYHAIVIVMVGDIDEEPNNQEPEKCAGWEWQPWNALPEPVFSSLQEAQRVGFDPFAI